MEVEGRRRLSSRTAPPVGSLRIDHLENVRSQLDRLLLDSIYEVENLLLEGIDLSLVRILFEPEAPKLQLLFIELLLKRGDLFKMVLLKR